MTEPERPEDVPPVEDFASANPYEPVSAPFVEPVPPRKPRPGLLLAIATGAAFLLVTVVGLVVGAVGDFGIRLAMNPDPEAVLKEIEKQLNTPGNTEMPPMILQSLGAGMLVGEFLSVFVALVFLRVVVGRGWTRKIALRLPKWHHLLVALLMLPALVIVHGIAHEIARIAMESVWPGKASPPTDQMFQEMFAGWPAWLAVLVIGFGPGIGEELCCRGYIGRGLLARYGYFVGVGMTSTIFGLMHGSVTYAIGTAVMGAFLHGTLLATRSLWIPIILHTLNNSFSVLASLKVLAIDTAEPLPDAPTPWLMYASSLLVTMTGFWLLYRTRVRVIDSLTGEAWRPPWASAAMPSDPRFVGQTRFPGYLAIAAFSISMYTLIHVLAFVA